MRCLEKNAGQFWFSNGSNTTATDGSTFVFRSRRSSFRLYTTCGGDLDSNRKTQGQYSNHWHHFAAFSRNRCFPSFPLGGVLFSSHPPQLSFFCLPDFGGIQDNNLQNPWPLIRLFLHEANGQVLDIVLRFCIIIKDLWAMLSSKGARKGLLQSYARLAQGVCTCYCVCFGSLLNW